MLVRQVKAHEIPLSLLRQKEYWNLKEFYRCAVTARNWHAFVWGELGEEWATMILIDDALYEAVVCDTVIVDENCQALVPEVLKSGWKIAEELAHKLGRKRMSAFSFSPKRHLEMLGNPPGVRRLETRLQKEF